MDKQLKWMLILNAAMFSFVMAVTSPVVHLYFVKLVDPQVYVTAGIIQTLLAAILTSFMRKEKNRLRVRKIFMYVLLLDSIGYALISLYGIDNITLRFIGMSFLSSISMTVWFTIMMDMINHKIKETELTNFQTTDNAFKLWANVAGGIVAITLVGNLSINIAIWIQCVANALFAFIDWKAYKGLRT